jgi:FMN phosphatase YigB (HAD superfamily)
MKNFKAIFFDRDGTLTYRNLEVNRQIFDKIREWDGTPYDLSYDETMELFEKAALGKRPWYKDVEDEISFMKRYHKLRLEVFGVKDNLDEKANIIHDMSWLKMHCVHPEVIEVLEYFKSNGYEMGVISDTSPSLELTLKAAGIAKHFTSFTASSLVGASKPSHAALAKHNVTAQESLYVDDYDVEADGARDLGFTSFLIDRDYKGKDKWIITSLMQIVEYVESI